MQEDEAAGVRRRDAPVVFLGDSITEGGNWRRWFPDVWAVNAGVGGDTAADVLARLASAVPDSGPAVPCAVLLLVGTNDLSWERSIAAITADVAAILDGIRQRAPRAHVVVQGVMPREAAATARVRELNAAYRALVDARPGVGYLDLWPALAASDGTLLAHCTEDQLHLTQAGYEAWLTMLRPVVASLTP
ncbi:MAG TPA: GDSL-type esterase/lipase family protein [Candidatus Nanopelagicales bacterium]